MRELLSAIIKTGAGTLVSLVLGAGIMKIIAITLGSSGVGLFSLLRQTQQTAVVVATFAGINALVQGLSSGRGGTRENYLATVGCIFLCGASIMAVTFLLLAPVLAGWILNQQDHTSITLIRWLVVPILFTIVSTYFTGVLNGYRAIGRMAAAQGAAAAAGLLLVYPLTKFGRPFAMVALLATMAIVWALVSAWFAVAAGWARQFRRGSIEATAARHFFSIAGVMLVTSLASAGTVLAIRAMFVHRWGLGEAGIFDVAWTLSMMYLLLLLNSFGTYYLPVLSSTVDVAGRVALINRLLRVCVLLAAPIITTVVVLKPLVIQVFYSHEFIPSLEIIRWMLVGDYLKVTSWVLALPMVAFADMKRFFWTEIIGNAALLSCAAWTIFYERKPEGVGVAFAGLYALYLAYTLFYCTSVHKLRLERRVIATWWLGLLIVLSATIAHWNQVRVEIVPATGWILLSVAPFCLGLRKEERKTLLAFVARSFKSG